MTDKTLEPAHIPLSDAMELGHTLIKENHNSFLSSVRGVPCGCAIGSARVALLGMPREWQKLYEMFEENHHPEKWLEKRWPWTKKFWYEFEPIEKLAKKYDVYLGTTDYYASTVAFAISYIHCRNVSRLEIAAALRECEATLPDELVTWEREQCPQDTSSVASPQPSQV